MSAIDWLKDVLEKMGEASSNYQDSHLKDSYTPRFTGQWVNKGGKKNENWVWVNKVKPIRPTWVNVFQIEDDYIITMGSAQRIDAIDSTKCIDEFEARNLMDCLACYYKHQGEVTVTYNNEF